MPVVPAGVPMNPAPASMPLQTPPSLPGDAAAQTPPVPPDGVRYFNLDELKLELRTLAWSKGDYSIVPYGILWANLVEESGRTYPGNYPLYVARPRSDANDDCYIDARSTRLGFDVLGPQIACLDNAQSGGKIEFDFQRQIDVENKASVLLRHAYVEVKNDEFRLLFGQTWDVISPLCPGVLFYSVGWDAGNIGYRRPQLRGERFLTFSDTVAMVAQGSLNTIAPSRHDGNRHNLHCTAVGMARPGGTHRLALRTAPPGWFPWEFGVSSHVGELIYDFHKNAAEGPFDFTALGVPRETWSLNADIRMPFGPRFGVQGELFMGQNLGSFLGGVGQTVDVTSYTDSSGVLHYASGDSIRSRGGWVNAWYNWTPRLHTHVGYSVERSAGSRRNFRPRLQCLLLRQRQLRRHAQIPGGIRVQLLADAVGRAVAGRDLPELQFRGQVRVLNDLAGFWEKGDWLHLPERPVGGHRRAALVVAQMVPVPFFPSKIVQGHVARKSTAPAHVTATGVRVAQLLERACQGLAPTADSRLRLLKKLDEFTLIQGLEQIVGGAQLQSIAQGIRRRLPRNDKDLGEGVFPLGVTEQAESVDARHFQVRHQDVDDLSLDGLSRPRSNRSAFAVRSSRRRNGR